MKKGKLIVIEGVDGSGKGTLTTMLENELRKRGERVRRISFPRYGEKSAVPVEQYLGGELGGRPEDTNAYAASTLFAVDRYLSYRTDWGKDLRDGVILIADRYTTANAVHQLTKLPREEWDGFLDWLFALEYEKMGLPVPDTTVYVEMLPEISKRLIAARGRGTDIHETDPTHLERAYAAGLYACEKMGWHRVKNYEGTEPRELAQTFAEVLAVTDRL